MNPELDPTPYAEREGYVPTLSVEEQAATEQLAALNADLITDDLRSEVLRVAQAMTLAREVQEARTEAQASARDALASDNVRDAAMHAGKVLALDQIVSMLPSTSLDQVIAEEVRVKATAYVNAARSSVVSVPVVAYTAQMEAWRSLSLSMQQILPPPPALPTDFTAERAILTLMDSRKRALLTYESWTANSGSGDVLNMLSSAAGTVDLLRKFATEVEEVGKTITTANKARKAAGIIWLPPSGISSPAITALASL